MRTIKTGLVMGESPRWHDGRLFVSDWGAGEILAIDDDGGSSEVVARVEGMPFCFDFLPDGRMLVVEGRAGRLMCGESLYADLTALAPPPWNDIVVDGRGNAYVGCTGFDFPGGEFAPGTVALVTPDGALRQLADDVAFPNGVAVTPDNATLILAESYGNRLTAWDIAADGSLSGRRVWADLGDGVPDGICIDADGAVWYADVPNACCVRVREGGEVLDRVALDRGGFACMLGGPDRATLYVVAAEWRGIAAAGSGATGVVVAVDAPAPGAGRP
jgi:sugar lactone lactonase YvrE